MAKSQKKESQDLEIQIKEKKTALQQLEDTIISFDKHLNTYLKNNIEKQTTIFDSIDRTLRKNNNSITKICHALDSFQETLESYKSKLDSIEDTFFTLFHSIKKNQWQFVNEPEEWYKDYSDLKAFYNKHNKQTKESSHD